MKTYKCDSCGVEIKEPYIEKMKEFCLSAEFDEHGVFPKPWKKKIKIVMDKDFSWDKTSHNYMIIYKELAKEQQWPN